MRLSLQNQEQFATKILTTFGIRGQRWLDGLPALMDSLELEWKFKIQSVIPNLTYSFVSIVNTLDGRTAVLKLALPGPRCDSEIAWYQANHKAVPALLKMDQIHGAILLEHIRPGNSLRQLVLEGNDIEATRTIAEVIRSLEPRPEDSSLFKPIAELVRDLDSLEDRGHSHLLNKARSIFRELSGNVDSHQVLHGDLHHGNIICSNNGWLAIDPHGYYGPGAFEIGAMIRNPHDCLPKHLTLRKLLKNRVEVLVSELPFEQEEILGWAFACTMLSIAWSASEHEIQPKTHLEICEILNEWL